MTASQRSKLSAVLLFLLIALVVLGGITWGTIVTFRLTEYNIREDRRQKVRGVVTLLDSHMRKVLLPESLRPFTEYSPEPVPALTMSSAGEVEDMGILVRSPLAEPGPPHAWIDLYFQVDDGRWSSPQIPPEDTTLIIGYSSGNQRLAPVRRMFEWLRQQYPMARLAERIASSAARDRFLTGGGTETKPAPAAQQVAYRLLPRSEAQEARQNSDFQQRTRSRVAAQREAVPPPQQARLSRGADPQREMAISDADQHSDLAFACVTMSSELPATFWIDDMPGEGRKLAFVRTAYRDDKVVYQGFIADWGRLKSDLLERVQDVLPDVDLAALKEELPQEPASSDTDLTWIPTRLEVPLPENSVASQAWRQVGGVLVTTWIAAVVVLGVAGVGVRNLVALTERRMQFAYAVTHELRTPLTTFRLYSDMLASGLVPEESKGEYLVTLNRESERLTTLVESVLEYSRLENHKVRLNPVLTDANELLNRIGETLTERCKAAGVTPHLRNLVPAGQSFLIDMDIIHQIAGVLINNACRHARDGKHPSVEVRLSSEADRLHVDVVDSGPGIDRADSRVIFKPFRRGRFADASAQGGIGLGLALARNWARFLKGRLDLAARHDPQLGGAHFRLTIPAQMRT